MIGRLQAYYAACRVYEANPTTANFDEMMFRLDMVNEL